MAKQKESYKLKCKCGKEIIGFSKHHAEQNLILHTLTSKDHKERVKLLKEKRPFINGDPAELI